MQKAVEMLKDHSLKIYDVSKKVGYESTSYFCQVFKQFYGTTPKDYMESVNKT